MRPHVLIVDDEPDVLLILRLNLEAAGLDMSLAADGVTALRRIERERPDIVLLDLMLPVLDGWAVLSELGNRTDVPPVIVCSAKQGPRTSRALSSSALPSSSRSPSMSIRSWTRSPACFSGSVGNRGWRPGPSRTGSASEGSSPPDPVFSPGVVGRQPG